MRQVVGEQGRPIEAWGGFVVVDGHLEVVGGHLEAPWDWVPQHGLRGASRVSSRVGFVNDRHLVGKLVFHR